MCKELEYVLSMIHAKKKISKLLIWYLVDKYLYLNHSAISVYFTNVK